MKELKEYLESDFEFALELTESMTQNLIEFRECLLKSIKLNDGRYYLNAYHKMKTTLNYLDNTRLTHQADLIKSIIKQKGIYFLNKRIINLFCRLCDSCVQELKNSLVQYKGTFL